MNTILLVQLCFQNLLCSIMWALLRQEQPSFTYSFLGLSDDRYIAPIKTSSQGAICASTFHFKYPSFLQDNPVADYVFFLVFPSFISILLYFIQQYILEGSCYVIPDKYIYPSLSLCYIMLCLCYLTSMLVIPVPLDAM